MLGEKLGEEHGRVTTRRVIPGGDPRYVQLEVSFESNLTLLGKQGQNIGTYTVFERVHGQLYAEGQGVAMFADGSSLIWNGNGVGQATADGGLNFAAAITFQAGGDLERLNAVMGLIEHKTGADGSAVSTIHEWKPQV